jgi:hypothetical protein
LSASDEHHLEPESGGERRSDEAATGDPMISWERFLVQLLTAEFLEEIAGRKS